MSRHSISYSVWFFILFSCLGLVSRLVAACTLGEDIISFCFLQITLPRFALVRGPSALIHHVIGSCFITELRVEPSEYRFCRGFASSGDSPGGVISSSATFRDATMVAHCCLTPAAGKITCSFSFPLLLHPPLCCWVHYPYVGEAVGPPSSDSALV